MRYIAIFLLLVNLAYFAWSYRQPEPPPAPPAAPRPLLNTGLMLMSEFQAQTAELARDDREDGRLCSVVRGFADIGEAGSFILSAQALGLSALLNAPLGPLPPQFRTYIPPVASRQQAAELLAGISERLASREILVETYLITRGELENAVALGVFASQEQARAVQEVVMELGYEAEIEELRPSENDIEVWLRSPDSDRVESSQWLDLSAERPNLTRSENVCETIAQASQFP